MKEIIDDWWQAIAAGLGALVWLVRLEGRVNMATQAHDELVRSEVAWRAAHAAEIVPQTRRIDEALERVERGVESLTETVADLRERMVGMERGCATMTDAMNGHMKPWDRKTERRRTP